MQEEQFHAKESQKKNLASKVNGVKKDGKSQNSESKLTKKQEAPTKKNESATNSPAEKQSSPGPKVEEKRQRTVKMTKSKETDGNK